MNMSASEPNMSRIGHTLNEHEEEFVTRRIKTVQQSLQKLGIDCTQDNVPKIALLGSGGGERAMLGLLGCLVGLDKIGLLDSILYLSGVSGSTWCMTSLYQESDWSTKVKSVKEKILQRLKGPGVSWSDSFSKLEKYYEEKGMLSLTDFWAVVMVTSYVKEIDEHTISEQQVGHDNDPFPIYNVIDKGCSDEQNNKDPWFEISPYEAGYTLTGAFVDVSKFGSKFQNGREIKHLPEMDMLYLQSLCGSAIADGEINAEYLTKIIIEFFLRILGFSKKKKENNSEVDGELEEDSTSLTTDEVHQVSMDLLGINPSVLKGEDPSPHEEVIRAKLSELDGGEHQLDFETHETGGFLDSTLRIIGAAFETLKSSLEQSVYNVNSSVFKALREWIWGRKYNFLYKVKDDRVPIIFRDSKKRDYKDAGILNNSPYMSVLRQERDVDLIISLDFSDGDAFETVKKAADTCREQNIPFPEVDIPPVEFPEDFYVFEGNGEAPTVIHIPLFNTVNCGANKIEAWREKYTTFQSPYSPDMNDPLLEVAGKNIENNKEKLLEEIIKSIGVKSAKH